MNPSTILRTWLAFPLVALLTSGCNDEPSTPDASQDAGSDADRDTGPDGSSDADDDGGTYVMVTLHTPNGGETWPIGSTQVVSWTSEGLDEVKIEFTTDGGANWSDVVEAVDAAPGRYEWTIPEELSNDCLVRVSEAPDGYPADTSAAAFSIVAEGTPSITVTTPVGGEIWRQDEEHELTWSWTADVGLVDLALSSDGGESWTDIATGEDNDGSFDWTVPTGTDSSRCHIRVQEADGEPGDVSERFTIRPPLPPDV